MKKTVSRKQFLQQMAWLSGGVAWGMGSMTGKAYAQMPAAFASAAGSLRGKALVIIQHKLLLCSDWLLVHTTQPLWGQQVQLQASRHLDSPLPARGRVHRLHHHQAQ
jgi:hypothetical protein